MTTISNGDVLIRHATGLDFELLDAATRHVMATTSGLKAAIDLAAASGGAVWRLDVDNRGRALGDPVLLLPASTVRHTSPAA